MVSEVLELQAVERLELGKGAARLLRRRGLVPAVVYGGSGMKVPVIHISLSYRDVWQNLRCLSRQATVVAIKLGDKEEKIYTIPKACQFDPLSDYPIHIDFMRVNRGAAITLHVPIQVVGIDVSHGLKIGGSLNYVNREVEISCPSDAVPEGLVVDVSGLSIGDTVCVADLVLPDCSVCHQDPSTVVLSVVGLSKEEKGAEGTS